MKAKWLVAGALCAAVSLPVSAQTSGRAAGVLLAPRAGWVVSVGELGRVEEMRPLSANSGGAGPHAVTLGAGPTIGGAALFDVPGLPVLWRVDLDHAPSLDVRLSGDRAPFDAAATFATAGIVTRETGGRVQPFGQAGIGFRALRFRAGEEDGLLIPEGRVDLLGRFGGGLAVHVGPVALTSELTALTSMFRFDDVGDGVGDREFHLDLAGMLGVRVRVF